MQIIEVETEEPDVITELQHRWEKQSTYRAHRYLQFCADRERPNTYVAVTSFDTPEDALLYAQDPATSEMLLEIEQLCGAPPRVLNLTVIRSSQSEARVA